MHGFISPYLDVRLRDDGKTRELLSSLIYKPSTADITITVPVGFTTDYASVPRILWNILPPTGKYTKASVIHDYLYFYDGEYTRKQADAIFLEAMESLDVGFITRYVMWSGVRMGGWVPWSNYRAKK